MIELPTGLEYLKQSNQVHRIASNVLVSWTECLNLDNNKGLTDGDTTRLGKLSVQFNNWIDKYVTEKIIRTLFGNRMGLRESFNWNDWIAKKGWKYT